MQLMELRCVTSPLSQALPKRRLRPMTVLYQSESKEGPGPAPVMNGKNHRKNHGFVWDLLSFYALNQGLWSLKHVKITKEWWIPTSVVQRSSTPIEPNMISVVREDIRHGFPSTDSISRSPNLRHIGANQTEQKCDHSVLGGSSHLVSGL